MWWAQLLNTISAFLGSGASGGGGSYESIATTTAAGGETSITFSSIAGTYASLQIRGIMQRNAAAAMNLAFRFNSDTGANYASHWLYGDGATVTATGASAATYALSVEMPSNTANTLGAFITDIHDYASTTKNKTIRTFGGYDKNGSGKSQLNSGLWVSTAAVTSVTLYFLGDALAAGSTFALYGIKGA